jgi:alpha-amylase/alpha-mannosidase (GH57 family)
MAEAHYLCVHCHYYQPPRGNPFTDEPLVEKDAAPYTNWNERVTAECYAPNAALGNFDLVSFNLGETLAAWLARYASGTYQRILEGDANHLARFGVGNAVAQGMHHTILPLARYEDKVTQVRWGKEVFAHRLGRPTQGLWLPEMAVDLETLEVLVDHGIEWTVLSEGQIIRSASGSGPFWLNLPGGKRIKVFVRDDYLSNDIAFNLGHFGGAGRWAREVLVARKREAGALTLIATDGETFGHHWRGEEQFLHWLLTYEARAVGYEVVTLNRYASLVTPVAEAEIRIKENTSWSCGHGLARWATGCTCTPGESTWKGALRRAMDNLRFEVDGVYLDFVKRLDGVDPYALRDGYIDVVVGTVAPEKFLAVRGIDLDGEAAASLMKLVEAQFYRQRMYSSCAFFFPELDAHATVYGIANGAFAIRLTREATGIDLSGHFRRDLSIATQRDVKKDRLIRGSDLYDTLIRELEGQ